LDLAQLRRIGTILKRTTEAGLTFNTKTGDLVNSSNWDLQNAIFLTTQIVGAVGYGNIVPRTVGGKVFTVFYACIGIPLFIIFAFAIGRPITRLIRYVEKRCCCFVLDDPATEGQREAKRSSSGNTMLRKVWVYMIRVFVLFAIGVVFFVIIPAIIFDAIEPWSYGESIYYCFVSVLSIGFGDFVPGNNVEEKYRNWYHLATAFWMYISVTYFVIAFYPFQEALDFRRSINKPIDLDEPDPQVFQDITEAFQIVNPVRLANGKGHRAGAHQTRTSGDPYRHSAAATNNGFEYGPYDHDPVLFSGSESVASIYPPLTTSPLARGTVTSLTVASS